MSKQTKSVTRRSPRSVSQVIESRLIFTSPLLALANEYRRRASEIEKYRKTDELVEIFRRFAAEIADAVQEGRKNEWVDSGTFAEIVGMEVDTVRRHCGSGKIAPAKKVGGVWVIHRSAIEINPQTEAA